MRLITKLKRNAERLPMVLVWAVCLVCIFLILLDMYGSLDYLPAGQSSAAISITNPKAIEYPESGINPNTASIEELCTLPGVGEKTARAFIEEREKNGAFIYPEDLLAVKGIGEKKLQSIRPLIRLQ